MGTFTINPKNSAMNKRTVIPDDPRKPTNPSGIRLGTPAVTTRGLVVEDCREVSELIVETLQNKDNSELKQKVHDRVQEIAEAHCVPDSFV